MNRAELEHIIRASSGITGQSDIVVIGSQAVLGQFPHPPPALTISMEADVFPRARPDLAIQIDGAIGERSMFHDTFGYYARGVAEDTAKLPPGWEARLIPIRNENTGGTTGWCLEVQDLAAAKLAAGREKDLNFVAILIGKKMISPDTLRLRVSALSLAPDHQASVVARLERLLGTAESRS